MIALQLTKSSIVENSIPSCMSVSIASLHGQPSSCFHPCPPVTHITSGPFPTALDTACTWIPSSASSAATISMIFLWIGGR